MHYILKSGILSNQEGQKLTKIKSFFNGPQKEIQDPNGNSLLFTDIHQLKCPPERMGDVRFRKYRLTLKDGSIITGEPGYMDGEDPLENGWPLNRMPRIDHVNLHLADVPFILRAENPRHYMLVDSNEKPVVHITHRGMPGGWNIDTDAALAAEILCGLFVFCRYMERDNEFLIV